MRSAMLNYIDEVTNLGNCLSDAISLSLGLDVNYMREKFLSPEPIAIVRSFKYFPPENVPEGKPTWGIGEHTGIYVRIIDRFLLIGSQTLDTSQF
jgi:isopenicillin N synthase-like dioxygenase